MSLATERNPKKQGQVKEAPQKPEPEIAAAKKQEVERDVHPLAERRQIPDMPERPCSHPVEGGIVRSYPVGRQNLSRACQGEAVELTITARQSLPDSIRVRLLTTLQSSDAKTWDQIPFVRCKDEKLTCRIVPKYAGLHSFRAEFSQDNGATWLRDTVADAWILIDPPQVDALRLYTLIPAVSGTIKDWETDLVRIRDMGFNAIHLLPVTAMDKSESPYAARDFFAVDSRYLAKGTTEDGLTQFEDFVKTAIKLGMKLCFDLVLNHVGVYSTMAQRAPDWIVPDESQSDKLKRARYWTDQGWQIWDDIVLINYEHPSEAIRSEIRDYMIAYALFWAKYANDTGGFVRFDNLHSSDPDFIQALTGALHTAYPEVSVIAEYFSDESTLLERGPRWGLNLMLATPWNYRFAPELRDYLNYIHRVSGQIRYYMPVTSHDSGAPAQEFGTPDSTIPRYVAAALLGTGATGIPQGVEFGEQDKIDFIGVQQKMVFPAEPRFSKFISRVNAILAAHPAFRHGQNCVFVDDGHHAVIAAFRRDTAPKSVGFLVACNFDTQDDQRITVDLQSVLDAHESFSCRDLLSEESMSDVGGTLELVLPPCAARVLQFSRIDRTKAS